MGGPARGLHDERPVPTDNAQIGDYFTHRTGIPTGGVASTAGDIAKWTALVLADGELNGSQFIDPVPLAQTFSAQVLSSHTSTIDQRPGHYGYGVNVGAAASRYFGTLAITSRDGRLEAAMGPNGGYTVPRGPWDGDTMAFEPHGENALPGSLSSAIFTRDKGKITGVTLTLFNKYPQIDTPSGLGVFTRTP